MQTILILISLVALGVAEFLFMEVMIRRHG